jgi:hypothetical protein
MVKKPEKKVILVKEKPTIIESIIEDEKENQNIIFELSPNSSIKEMLNYIWVKYNLSKSSKEITQICSKFASINIYIISEIIRKSMNKIGLSMGL